MFEPMTRAHLPWRPRLYMRSNRACTPRCLHLHKETPESSTNQNKSSAFISRPSVERRVALAGLVGLGGAAALSGRAIGAPSPPPAAEWAFQRLDSDVEYVDVKEGRGARPALGSFVTIHWSGRVVAKQGWTFGRCVEASDCEYTWRVGDGSTIEGLDRVVLGMKAGGIRRAVIGPKASYQTREQGPLPDEQWGRQRLWSTVFNQTRINNGEGDTLATVLFDVELVRVQP